jgi:hypothetical protein
MLYFSFNFNLYLLLSEICILIVFTTYFIFTDIIKNFTNNIVSNTRDYYGNLPLPFIIIILIVEFLSLLLLIYSAFLLIIYTFNISTNINNRFIFSSLSCPVCFRLRPY